MGAEAETEFSAAAAIGYEYDSNVSVDEVERSSGEGDNALVIDVDLAVDQTFGEDLKGGLSYGYSRTDYNEFSALSRETHISSAPTLVPILAVSTPGSTISTSRPCWTARTSLPYQRASPSLSGFVSKRWFLRGAYVYGDKVVDNRPGRDAESHGGEFDAYYFWRGLRRYINVGYVYKTEDSVAARFDYDSHAAKFRFLQRFELFGDLAALELAARFEARDYRVRYPQYRRAPGRRTPAPES